MRRQPSFVVVQRPHRHAAVLLGLALLVGALVSPQPSQAAGPLPPSGPGISQYRALVPSRVVDTTTGLGGHSGAIAAGQTVSFMIAGKGGVPDNDVRAVVLSATAISSQGANVTVYRGSGGRPSSPNVTVVAGEKATNMVITQLSDAGTINVYSTGSTHLRLDVVGWHDQFTFLSYDPTLGAQMSAVPPAQVLNTSANLGHAGKFEPGESIRLTLTGRNGIPATGVKAVAIALLATGAGRDGNVTVVPAGAAKGTTTLAYQSGERTSAMLYAPVSSTGRVSIMNAGGPVHLKVFVLGYYDLVGDKIVTGDSSAVKPVVVADTRNGRGTPAGRIGAGQSRVITVAGLGEVPPIGVSAVAINIQASAATAETSIAVYDPTGTRPPGLVLASPGRPTNTLILSPISWDGQLRIRNANGLVHVRATVVAWYSFVIPPPPDVPPPDGAVNGGAQGPPATAGNPESPSGDRSVARSQPQKPSDVLKYWTEDRIRNAKPHHMPGDGSAGSNIEGYEPAHSSQNQTPLPYGDNKYMPTASYSNAVGRLFYTMPNGFDNYCSATVVARNLLLTAAHCVYQIGSGNMTNFLFIPKLAGNSSLQPWAAVSANWYNAYCGSVCSPGLETNVFWPLDYALIRVPPTTAGQYIGDVLGFYQIASNSQGNKVFSQGYPGEGYFAQNCAQDRLTADCWIWYCYTSIGQYHQAATGWWEAGFGCSINGGASGGPIFQYLGDRWYVTSVISHIANIVYYPTASDRWFGGNTWGPYFNQWVIDLWNMEAVR